MGPNKWDQAHRGLPGEAAAVWLQPWSAPALALGAVLVVHQDQADILIARPAPGPPPRRLLHLTTSARRSTAAVALGARAGQPLLERLPEGGWAAAELAGGALLTPYVSQPDALSEAREHRLTVDQKRELIRVLVGRVRILPGRPGLPRFDPDRVVSLGDA